jgi:hypothetical protein
MLLTSVSPILIDNIKVSLNVVLAVRDNSVPICTGHDALNLKINTVNSAYNEIAGIDIPFKTMPNATGDVSTYCLEDHNSPTQQFMSEISHHGRY